MSDPCEAVAPTGQYYAEVSVTEWAIGQQPRVVAGPRIVNLNISDHPYRQIQTVPLNDSAAYCLQLDIQDLGPAGPGWLGGTMELTGPDGSILGRQRPLAIFATPTEIASNVNFGPTYYGPTYTVQARITHAPDPGP